MNLAFIFPFLFFAIVPATVGISDPTAYEACFATCNIELNKEKKLDMTKKSVTCFKRCKPTLTDQEAAKIRQDIKSLPPEQKALFKRLMTS
ncbi:unnamed protein product [Cylicocyclus nassatus]|uniref:Uncharacterized protein n=1 Tax=Cylicocyclus nassatus TaxID=53992 RepID=A0AA36MB90_CYLNA|nr:unnamed protein product [Cylicocyclus nassatus]